jgi:hypothetical protein
MKNLGLLGGFLGIVFFTLSGCATNEEASSDGTSTQAKTAVPGQDVSGGAGGLAPAANAGGAGANVRF